MAMFNVTHPAMLRRFSNAFATRSCSKPQSGLPFFLNCLIWLCIHDILSYSWQTRSDGSFVAWSTPCGPGSSQYSIRSQKRLMLVEAKLLLWTRRSNSVAAILERLINKRQLNERNSSWNSTLTIKFLSLLRIQSYCHIHLQCTIDACEQHRHNNNISANARAIKTFTFIVKP